MKLRPSLFAAALLAAALAACGDKAPEAPEAPAAPQAQSPAVDPAAVAKEVHGFTVGSDMAARHFYVLFDPQCPHCAALWQAAKPLKSQAAFTWVPVQLLNPTSLVQGATILASSDPVATMDKHEELLASRQGGIPPAGDIEAQKKLVEQNTALMNRYGFGGVPVIIGKNAATGQVVVHEGALPTPQLAQALGLQVPVGN